MNALLRSFMIILLAVSCLFGTGTCLAGSAADVLSKHPITGVTSAAPSNASQETSARVYLNTDGLVTKSKDMALMKLFKAELEKYGITVIISPYCSGPNDHVLSIKNMPPDHWLVTAASGVCAGTFRDMALGKKGYLRSYWTKNRIKGLIFLNLSPYQLKGMKFLPKAWDDNFSGASFKGLENPYDYITSNGMFVAESPEHTKPCNNPKRVPILAKQIAEIVGRGGMASSSGSKSESAGEEALVSTAKNDTSQSSARVAALQSALIKAGYYYYLDNTGKRRNCRVDGWFGPYTKLGVMEYQRDHGLPVTGVADQALCAKLIGTGSIAASAGTPTPSTQASSQPGKTSWAPAGYEKYLASSKGSPANNATIVAKAKQLKGKTAMETVRNIFNFGRKITYQYYANTRKGALGTLSSMSGNCTDQAHVLVSLLRACGIPAQYGHCTSCVWRSGLRGGHVWAYAYVDGKWVGLDTTSSRNAVGQLNSFRALGSIMKKVELSF
ncbi:MAG TPA: transglutaminase domain-containing protein [Candidatus Ozemobacteraceae bacterium]|nr:transglutaminase domain-containing protein [Candidatus Ozemobacteraceae bacterium]